jgi:hypothetical protein
MVIADAIIFTGAFGLRREVVDDGAGDQAAQRRRDGNQPQPMRPDHLAQHTTVLRQARRHIARHPHQEKLCGEPQQPGEQLRAQAADDSEDQRIQQKPRLVSGLHAISLRFPYDFPTIPQRCAAAVICSRCAGRYNQSLSICNNSLRITA